MPPPVFEDNGLYWVAAETVGSCKYGDHVPGVAAVPVDGGKSVHTMAGGALIFVACIRGRDRPAFLRRPSGWDLRATQTVVDGAGKAEASLKDVVEKCREEPVSWQLQDLARPSGVCNISWSRG